MFSIINAAVRLKEICTRHGSHPAARGACDAEVQAIRQTFLDLDFPLPEALLEVYKVTLAIPGVLNSEPVLGAPASSAGLQPVT